MFRISFLTKLPKPLILVVVFTFVVSAAGTAQAISFGRPGGDWPKSWPKELEPLRKQAWTWEHGFGGMSYDIPFDSREEFEAAWPIILSLKSKGAPITLMRGPYVRVKTDNASKGKSAGVRIIPPLDAPPTRVDRGPERRKKAPATDPPPASRPENAPRAPAKENQPAAPATPAESKSERPAGETKILLVVDGEIVDLNRIELPADTPIIDRRFEDREK